MGRRRPEPDDRLAFPQADGAGERALEMFGIDIEASLRSWFDDMGLTQERVDELVGRSSTRRLGPGRPHSFDEDDLSLSERQRMALSYMACGYTRAETAERMSVTEETIKTHVANARFRLRASNVAQGILIAALLGELDSEIIAVELLRFWDT